MIEVSVKGRPTLLRSISSHGVDIICRGSVLVTGQIFDEYWLQRSSLPPVESLLTDLRARSDRPDLFTFSQWVPDVVIQHPNLHVE